MVKNFVMGSDEVINKLADILGIPDTVKDWRLTVALDDVATIEYLGYFDKSLVENEKLQKFPERFRLEELVPVEKKPPLTKELLQKMFMKLPKYHNQTGGSTMNGNCVVQSTSNEGKNKTYFGGVDVGKDDEQFAKWVNDIDDAARMSKEEAIELIEALPRSTNLTAVEV